MRVHRALQYDDTTDAIGAGWLAADHAAPALGRHPAMLRRLAQEHADLSQALPLNESSSAWVRCHPARMDVVQIALSAPAETPYSAGLFVFDVRFPATYPASPPQFRLLTTGGKTVRFNPNLYDCGKVCLSLLGTWDGRDGETWNESTSTLLQVVVSIQSLIFVPEPYFNEPGYEKQMGTPRGDDASAMYSAGTKEQALRWAVLDQLRATAQNNAFHDVIQAHFALRRDFLLAQVDDWIADARDRHGKRCAAQGTARPPPGHAFFELHATKLVALRAELVPLLAALPEPQTDDD